MAAFSTIATVAGLVLSAKSAFTKPKAPQVVAPPPTSTPAPVSTPAPTRDDPSIQEAAAKRKREEAARKGRRATILTSPRGIEDSLGSVARPEAGALLGG